MPRAYIEIILSSNPVQRVCRLATIFGLERGLTVARSLQLQLAEVALQMFAGRAVARVTTSRGWSSSSPLPTTKALIKDVLGSSPKSTASMYGVRLCACASFDFHFSIRSGPEMNFSADEPIRSPRGRGLRWRRDLLSFQNRPQHTRSSTHRQFFLNQSMRKVAAVIAPPRLNEIRVRR